MNSLAKTFASLSSSMATFLTFSLLVSFGVSPPGTRMIPHAYPYPSWNRSNSSHQDRLGPSALLGDFLFPITYILSTSFPGIPQLLGCWCEVEGLWLG